MPAPSDSSGPSPADSRPSTFQRFWSARVLSSISFQMLSVAIGWHIYTLTQSAYALGLVGLAQFLPMFVLTLVAGHVADRYDRRRVVAVCQSLLALASAVFLAGTLGGWLNAPAIYALAACLGAARAFENPTVASLLPAVVARAELPRATALSTSATQTALIIGPAAGGVLYGLGPQVVYLLGIACFGCAACLMGSLKLSSKPVARAPVTLESVFSGIAFIRREPAILGALSLDLFAVLFGGAVSLLPIYARDFLHTGPWGLGLLRSAPAIGALAGTLWFARFPMRKRPGMAMFLGVIVFGLATLVFGLSTWLPLSLLALATLGAADVISVVVRSSLVQLRTPDEMLGRVSAVNALFIGTSNQLGEFESGITAGWWGAQPAVLIGGACTIAVALLWMRLFPSLRTMRSLEAERK